MRRMTLTFVLMCLASLSAMAAPKYRVEEVVNTGVTLTSADSVYIVVPRDGEYGSKPYRGSGQATANATRAAFARHLQRTTVVPGQVGETTEQSISAASASGHSYYCQLEIFQWVDRATEWSGKRDKIEIKLSLYDTATKQLVRSAIIEGFSKFWTFGGDHPQDLAFAHMHVLVDSLF